MISCQPIVQRSSDDTLADSMSMADFSLQSAGATDFTETFVSSAQALLSARRSIVEGRIVSVEPRFPFAIG